MTTTSGLVRSSAAVATGTALSRITGLVRVGVLAGVLGASLLSDAYNLANTTPNIVYELLLGGVLSATLVPLFVEAADRNDNEGPSAVLSVAAIVLVGLTALAMVAAPLIVDLYALRLPSAQAEVQTALAVVLLWIFLPQMFFYGFNALWTALLHARRRFVAAAYAPVLNNVVVVGALLLFGVLAKSDVSADDVRRSPLFLTVLGGGTTLGIVVMTLVLLPVLRRAGWRLRWHPDFRHPMVRQVVRLSGWTFGYVAANQVALFVVYALANASAGDVSTYQYAFIFFQLPHGLVAVSVMTTFAPELAAAANNSDWAGFRARFASGSQLLSGLLLPAAVGLLILAKPIVSVLLQRGQFSNADAAQTGRVLAWFAVGLIGFSLYLFALRGFYALRDTRTPFMLNLFENGLNVVLAFALVGAHGVEGLGAAYAVAYTVAAVVALAALRRRVGGVGGRTLAAGLVRITAASAVMGIVVYALRDTSLLAAVSAGVVVYGVASVALWWPAPRRVAQSWLDRR